MGSKKDQHKVGTPAKPRGQQTGFAGTDQNREHKAETPALRGRRKLASKMYNDQSSQHIGGDSVTPNTNAPSTPAMNNGGSRGKSGGEEVFKRRLERIRAKEKR
jgi:hypothetical protein